MLAAVTSADQPGIGGIQAFAVQVTAAPRAVVTVWRPGPPLAIRPTAELATASAANAQARTVTDPRRASTMPACRSSPVMANSPIPVIGPAEQPVADRHHHPRTT